MLIPWWLYLFFIPRAILVIPSIIKLVVPYDAETTAIEKLKKLFKYVCEGGAGSMVFYSHYGQRVKVPGLFLSKII